MYRFKTCLFVFVLFVRSKLREKLHVTKVDESCKDETRVCGYNEAYTNGRDVRTEGPMGPPGSPYFIISNGLLCTM